MWFSGISLKLSMNFEKIAMMRDKFIILSFLLWLIPFCARITMNISYENMPALDYTSNSPLSILYTALENSNNKEAFILVFKNNITSCVINICGGVSLGIGTIVNLAYNGFITSDMFVSSYEAGFHLSDILKTTLPHSFELIGFWLSGAMGFMIAYRMILLMKGREDIPRVFLNQMGIMALVVFVTTLCAAYVETYISINMLK